jgi:hypothetical protein
MMTTTKQAMAMNASRESCTRPWQGSNTSHAVDLGQVRGSSVPFAGDAATDAIVGVRLFGGTTAPTTGFVYPRLEAPPV